MCVATTALVQTTCREGIQEASEEKMMKQKEEPTKIIGRETQQGAAQRTPRSWLLLAARKVVLVLAGNTFDSRCFDWPPETAAIHDGLEADPLSETARHAVETGES